MSLLEQLAQIANPTPVFQDPEDDLDRETTARLVDFHEENEYADSDLVQPKSVLRLQNAASLADVDSRYAGKKTSRRQLQKVALSDSNIKTQFGKSKREGSDNELSDSGDSDASKQLDADDVENEEEEEEDDDDDEDEEHTLREFRAQLEKSALKTGMDKFGNSKDEDDDSYDNDDDDDDEDENQNEDEEEEEEEEEDEDLNENEADEEETSRDLLVINKHMENSAEEDSGMDIDNEDEREQHSDALGLNTVETFSKMHLNEDAEKGTAVKSQLRVWDALLECRIKLQKVLVNANQLPQLDVWPLFSKQGGKNYDEEAQSTQQSIKALLDVFIELQALLLSKNFEFKKMFKVGKVSKSKDESDEEIPSDTEDEVDTENDDVEEICLKRKLKVAEYPQFLKKRHMDLEYFRNNTIQKWNDKTKVSSGKVNKSFSGFEQSALKQIEQILQDEDRLVRRTQLKRSSYELLGKDLTLDIENGQGQAVSGQEAVLKQDFHLKDYDVEIFDDNDFYHQLLRELIERKTADVQDPIVLGRQWLEIQRMRSKMKRKIDTRASKGRKIRYDVHSKLMNFMAPIDECTMPEESRKDLFNSLFGRRWQGPENATSV